MINGPIPDKHLDPDFPPDYEDMLIESEDHAAHCPMHGQPDDKTRAYIWKIVQQHRRDEVDFGRKAE